MSSSMENLTAQEIADLASLQLLSLEVHKTPLTPFDVAIKSYVDSKYNDAVAAASAGITALIDGAPAQLDTLKEISTSLNNNADLAGVLVSSISSVSSSVTAEAVARAEAVQSLSNAVDVEKALRDSYRSSDSTEYKGLVTSEAGYRAQDVNALRSEIAIESVARVLAEGVISSSVDTERDERVVAIGELSQNKMDVSPNFTSGGSESYPKASSYLYIGDLWRIAANTSGAAKRLEFQYSASGLDEDFKTAVPFIRA